MSNKGTCKAASCERAVVGKGYCQRHYRSWKRGELPKARYKTCTAEGCRKRAVNAMRCEEHAKRKAMSAASAPAPEAASAPAAEPAS
jgi:hypothetical protein